MGLASLDVCIRYGRPSVLDSLSDISTAMTPLTHSSAMPGARRQAMLDDLGEGRLPPAFLYESSAQSELWLAVHEACSPVHNEPDCLRIYDWIAEKSAEHIGVSEVSAVSLGCGGGQKDSALLKRLNCSGYWPVDISESLTQEAVGICSTEECHPVVIDLARARDIGQFIGNGLPDGMPRIFILFGILPNFDSELIRFQLSQLMKPSDWLVLSANLAPIGDYGEGVRGVMGQYDNEPTRAWLGGALSELGVPKKSGILYFSQEMIPSGLRRIVAQWKFEVAHNIDCSGVGFLFNRGENLEVFHSVRHTIPIVLEWIQGNNCDCVEYRSSRSGEEAVFLCRVR